MQVGDRPHHRRAFTIVELLVSIGVILVLIGVLLPALGRARAAATLSAQLQGIRQANDLLMLYADGADGRAPLGRANQFDAMVYWYEPLVARELLSSPDDLDRGSSRRGLQPPYAMSASLCTDADYYRPERAEYPTETERSVTPVRMDQVVYPSGKGTLFTWRIGYITEPFEVAWCCLDKSLPAPLAFADGSAESLAVQDCFTVAPIREQDLAGVPVHSTWYGVRGRDR